MNTDLFDYELPSAAIAQRPARDGSSRLLVVDATGDERYRHVVDLPSILLPGDLLVVNDTEVIPARLHGHRLPGGGRVEALLLDPDASDPRRWQALLRPAKRLRPGQRLQFGDREHRYGATLVDQAPGGRGTLCFDEDPRSALARIGHVPLPPYIQRADDRADREDYQTVFARVPGAVAAPTAGLHFHDALLDALSQAGIQRATVTLHVGIGTFRPVASEDADQHEMDAERFVVPQATVDAIARTRDAGGRVVAVGTTVVRALETAAGSTEDGSVVAGAGSSRLFIRPGFRFQVVDALLTNFHLPRSTLLMLVSAFAGRRRILAAYREAVDAGFRFYSYGDAMLLRRQP